LREHYLAAVAAELGPVVEVLRCRPRREPSSVEETQPR
jgi:hypothetical protein